MGSRFFAKDLSPEDKARIRAMVNIVSLGLSDTKVWVAHADKAMLEAAGVIARAAKLPVAGVNLGQAGD